MNLLFFFHVSQYMIVSILLSHIYGKQNKYVFMKTRGDVYKRSRSMRSAE